MKKQKRIFQPEETACKSSENQEGYGVLEAKLEVEGDCSIEFNGQSSKR